MADVQLDKGYTKIANQLLEELAKVKLSPTQFRLIFVIFRYTYGFNRKIHDMSLNFLSKATGCNPRQIQRELKILEKRNVIVQEIRSGCNRKITFVKDFDRWIGRNGYGDLDNGELTNGQSINITFGNSDKGTIGEIDNQEINKEIYINIDYDKPNPFLEYENNFGKLSKKMYQILNRWIESNSFQDPEAIICEIIRRAKSQNPSHPESYIDSILNHLSNLRMYTIKDVRKYNDEFDNRSKSKNYRIPTLKNMFNNTKGVKRNLSKKEIQDITRLEDDLPY
ncbi:MAG: hypothetical protein K0S51_2279 [Bacillales bacterium]|jgi:phage replication O-like protein O|nr:hypothetical protein [Bacillales bacterium]